MTSPPIHIVVEHARITLTGRVASETSGCSRSLAR